MDRYPLCYVVDKIGQRSHYRKSLLSECVMALDLLSQSSLYWDCLHYGASVSEIDVPFQLDGKQTPAH